MACPCCYPCTCNTSWDSREGNLTSMTYSVTRLNCAGFTISETLSIPPTSPNPQQSVEVYKAQQNSNECVSGPNGMTGVGAAYIYIFFRRCPLRVLFSFRDYYQMKTRVQEGAVVPWAPCDPVFFDGQGVDNSKAYHEFTGINTGSNSYFFATESGKLWSDIAGPWCASLKTAQDTLDFTTSQLIPQSNAQDFCVRTKRDFQGTPDPAITISYEHKIKLSFNVLP